MPSRLTRTDVKKIWKVYGSNESASRNAATGALMAIGAFSIHSVFDGLYLMPLCSFNLCVFAGAILGTLPENLNRINYERIGIVFTVAVGGWFFFWLTQPYRLGVEVTQQGDLKAAEQYFSLASERDKTLSLSWQQLGLVKSVLANNGDEAALVAAIHAFEEAIRLDPAYSANYANLAALYQQKGDLEEAIHQWYQAVKLAPQSALFAINLGQNLEMVGRDSEARQQYVHVLDLEPGWANDGFWNRTDLRMDFLLNWKNMNSSAENPLITEEDALKQSLAGPFLVLAQQKILENDLSSASRMLNLGQLAYIGYRVQRLEITWLRAEIAAGQEKWLKAADLGELALDGFRQQGVDGPGSAGLSLYSYGLYRLSSLPMELVPQMTTIHLPDQWQDRMVRLGEWHSEADNQQGCLDIMNELMQYNPDFLFQLGEEKLPCEPAR